MKKDKSLEQETFINLLKTSDRLLSEFARLFKRYGISEPQFNVLRILRGAGKDGLPCQKIGGRMITRLPDVTRLLNRLEKQGLVKRERSSDDRRIIMARLTMEGEKLLRKLDKPVLKLHKRQLGHLSKEELKSLNQLLKKARL